MALGDYTATVWANGTSPAINATNLAHIETKLDEIDGSFQGVTPAPRRISGSTALGSFVSISASAGSALVLPSGGTWSYFYIRFTDLGAYSSTGSGVASGGTTIGTAVPTYYYIGFACRET